MTCRPRTMITSAILSRVEALTLLIFFIRLYFVGHINQLWSSILAIFATFLTTSETEVMKEIKTSSSKLMIFVLLKTLKCILCIMVFTINNSINDYFIGYYFWVTTLVGYHYFKDSGFIIEDKPYYRGKKQTPIDINYLNKVNLSTYLNDILEVAHNDLISTLRDINVYKL
jgi:hypothetical protein